MIGVDSQKVTRLSTFEGGVSIASEDVQASRFELLVDGIPVSLWADLIRFDQNPNIHTDFVRFDEAINDLLTAQVVDGVMDLVRVSPGG